MSTLALTDTEARQRASSELTTTFLIEAGAGTGKTTVLLSRVMALLRSGRSRVDRLAAITFSEKSAAEIRSRLRTEIERTLAEPLTEDEYTNLRRARWQLDRAQITTVHAFCAALLRERPVEAQIDPQFSVLSQFDAHLVQAEVWREWLTQEIEHSPSVLKQAFRAGLTLPHLETLRDYLLEQRDCLTLLPPPVPSPLPELQERFPQLLASLVAYKSACKTATDRAFAHIQRLEMLTPSQAEDTQWEQFISLEVNDIVASAKIGSKTKWQPSSTLEEVRTLFRQVADLYTESRERWFHNLSLGLVQWLMSYLRAYEYKKREHSQLDFTDLLLMTRNLLKNNQDTRRYFQRRFDCLLVDEFQDTDPLQAEIVFFLAEREPRAAEWTEVILQPGKLFLVGDPQQSIYRFRRADLEVYTQVRTLVAQHGKILTLGSNFRTRAPVLTWMNETFAPAFAETTGDQPHYQPLAATRPETTGRELIAVPIPTELLSVRPTRDELRQAEARTIAAMLKHAITYGTLSVWGDRPIEYRDVAVLFRTHRAIEAYEEAFAHAGIPYRVIGGRRYANQQEIEDLRRLLFAVERPTDPSFVVAVLRSSVFGFSDEELAHFVIKGGKFDALHPSIPEELSSADRFALAFTTLQDLHVDSAELSPAALLYKVYKESHIFPLFALRPHGLQRVANLMKLVDIAQSLATRGVQTLSALNRFLLQQQIAGEEEEAFLTEEEDNIVRLLTVHKAKGLEFPVVVLADMAASPNPGGGKTGIIERASGTLELRIGPQTLTCTTLGWQKAESRERLRDIAEEWRLRYVAAARVRDHLLMPVWPAMTQENNSEDEQTEQRTENTIPAQSAFSLSASATFSVYMYMVDPASIEQTVPTSPSSPMITHVPANAKALQTYNYWQAERCATIEKGTGAGAAPIIVATVAHQHLSLTDAERHQMDASADASRQRLHWAIQALLDHPEQTAQEIATTFARPVAEQEEITTLLATVGEIPLLVRARQTTERWVGVPFTLQYHGHFCQGTIDLAFATDDTWVIGYVYLASESYTLEEETVEIDTAPLFLQAFAFEQLTGKLVREVVLVTAQTGKEQSLFWGDTERHAVIARLARSTPANDIPQ